MNNAIAVLHATYRPTYRRHAPFPGHRDLAAYAHRRRCACGQPDRRPGAAALGTAVDLRLRGRWHCAGTGMGSTGTGSGSSTPTGTSRIRPGRHSTSPHGTAIVPVVIPTTTPASGTGPLNFLYSGADMWFRELGARQGARVRDAGPSPRDHGRDRRSAPGRPQSDKARSLTCKNPAEPDRPGTTGRSPTRGSRGPRGDARRRHTATLHKRAGLTRRRVARRRRTTMPRPAARLIPPSSPVAHPTRHHRCRASSGHLSNMGFWYQNADLGPLPPCTTSTGSPPKFDTASWFARTTRSTGARRPRRRST